MDESRDYTEEVQLPKSEDEVNDFGKSLLSESIDEAILKKEVTNVSLKEADDIIVPSYLVDFSHCETVLSTTVDVLSGMLLDLEDLEEINNKRIKRGDTALVADTALYIKNYEGVILAGMGDGYIMYRQLENFIKASFGDKVKVYKNNGNGFGETKKNDVTSVKLRLE